MKPTCYESDLDVKTPIYLDGKALTIGEIIVQLNALGEWRELARQQGIVLALVKQKWTFDNRQWHTHTWHDWADCYPGIKAALEALKKMEKL